MVEKGEYVIPTECEIFDGELMYLENLKMDDDCLFFGAHIYNLRRITMYFKYSDEMIRQFKNGVEEIDKNKLGLLDS